MAVLKKKESDRKIRKKINKLKDEYKTKIKGIYALLIGAIGYCEIRLE